MKSDVYFRPISFDYFFIPKFGESFLIGKMEVCPVLKTNIRGIFFSVEHFVLDVRVPVCNEIRTRPDLLVGKPYKGMARWHIFGGNGRRKGGEFGIVRCRCPGADSPTLVSKILRSISLAYQLN